MEVKDDMERTDSFPTELFVDQTENDFTCPICVRSLLLPRVLMCVVQLCIPKYPAEVPCGHVGCTNCMTACVNKSSTCPSCRSKTAPDSLMTADYLPMKIGGLKVHCANQASGCAHITLLDVASGALPV